MTTRFVQNGAVQLAVETLGNPVNPPVLLVHGYPDNRKVWDALCAELEADCYLIRYDVRGAGESTRPQAVRDYAIAHLVSDMRAVIEATSPDRPVHLVAHDWGSIQSWEAVAAGDASQYFASFTSISGPGFEYAAHWMRAALRGKQPRDFPNVLRQLSHSWYIFAFQLPGIATLASTALSQPRLLVADGREAKEITPHQADDARFGVNLYRANALPRLLRPQPKRISLPVQLVIAERDRFVSVPLVESMMQWLDRPSVRRIDAGHWCVSRRARAMATMLREWIADFK